jgi:hypothetical protein
MLHALAAELCDLAPDTAAAPVKLQDHSGTAEHLLAGLPENFTAPTLCTA